MRVAITGHRPERIKDMVLVRYALARAYHDIGVTTIIQGMAAGVDIESAKACIVTPGGAKWWSVKPWAGHTPRIADRDDYQKAWGMADKRFVVNESEKYLGPWMYQRRNEWMVDHSDKAVLAVWDGVEKGGTWNCIKYARSIEGIRIWRIDPDTGELHG